MGQKEKQPKDDEILTYDLVLSYSPDDPKKALDTLRIIKLTETKLREHCVDKDALSYTQLRNILQEVKQNEENLVVIIPKLAYMEARQEKPKQKELVRYIRELLEKAIEAEKEKVFIEYMDTLVAYHKYYSTKKNK